MKVRAKERRVWYTPREAGDVFEVGDGETASWFEPIEQPLEGQKEQPDNDPLGIQALDTPPEEPQPETDNKPRKTNKPA